MKRLTILPILIVLSIMQGNAQTSTKQDKVMLVFTGYLNMTVENMDVNVDSLLRIYKEYFFDKNPYYLNTKIIRHWYGHDSREVTILTELRSWDDIAKADAKREEIESQVVKIPGLEKAGKQWFSVITPEHHSDEICRVVAE